MSEHKQPRDTLGQERLRRFEFGTDDEDLEAMQRDFLKNSSHQPAARVISRGTVPEVVGSGQSQSQTSCRDPLLAASGDVLSFAKSMTAALDDFEAREQCINNNEHFNQGPAQPKKLSVFAQRRLAQQTGSKLASSEPGPSSGNSSAAHSTLATFLPKLMAPVPEHEVVGPIHAPELKPRETGFPSIPVDFAAPNEADPQARSAGSSTVECQGGDTLSQMRQQISQENDSRIQGMSEAEILEAQAEIRAMASSATIQRLLRRKQELAPTTGEASLSIAKDSSAKKHVRFAESAGESAESSGDEEDEGALAVPPPPPAEWVDKSNGGDVVNVDNNEIGAESEFYRDMKRKYFPSEMLEEAKLAWILGHSQAKSPMEKAIDESRRKDASAVATATPSSCDVPSDGQKEDDLMAKPVSHIRFAFDGQIMTELESDTPTYAGLHHHGDNPDKPGYTIPELLHLSRSTVPAQRTVAMSTLGCIMHKVNIGAWALSQAAEVYAGLLDWQAELYFAQGIRDSSKTGRVEATVALWTFVVEMAKYKTLVRLSNGGNMEEKCAPKPGAEINMLATPVVAQGVLVDQTFRALGSLLSDSFLDSVYELVDLSLVPDRQLTMIVEVVKCLMGMSDEFGLRVHVHGRLPVLLQNRYQYLMNN
ncbi:hypothetical protein IWW37_005333 [Coemansia sp. RSA 2050]|nr:hypothetical protein IWW37_005333 [Coemansia sp. RSA 2050]KAJ2730348.1 hypothetical protein IW152_005306 [Coemansia sp. BCRC 34962]